MCWLSTYVCMYCICVRLSSLKTEQSVQLAHWNAQQQFVWCQYKIASHANRIIIYYRNVNVIHINVQSQPVKANNSKENELIKILYDVLLCWYAWNHINDDVLWNFHIKLYIKSKLINCKPLFSKSDFKIGEKKKQ